MAASRDLELQRGEAPRAVNAKPTCGAAARAYKVGNTCGQMNPRTHYQICVVGAMAALFVAVANYFNFPHAQNFLMREALTVAVASVLLVAGRKSKAKIKH